MNEWKPLVSNIEGLDNYTILQTLESFRQYIVDNAKQGPQGEPGETGPAGPQGVSVKSVSLTEV